MRLQARSGARGAEAATRQAALAQGAVARLSGQLGALERRFCLPAAPAAPPAAGGSKEPGIDGAGAVPWQPSGVARVPLEGPGSAGPVRCSLASELAGLRSSHTPAWSLALSAPVPALHVKEYAFSNSSYSCLARKGRRRTKAGMGRQALAPSQLARTRASAHTFMDRLELDLAARKQRLAVLLPPKLQDTRGTRLVDKRRMMHQRLERTPAGGNMQLTASGL